MPVAIGDTIAALQSVRALVRERHARDQVYAAVAPGLLPILAHKDYRNIKWLPYTAPLNTNMFDVHLKPDMPMQFGPTVWKSKGLIAHYADYFGVDENHSPPKTARERGGSPHKKPYVCVALRASETLAKHWLHPGGWEVVLQYLKDRGYDVFVVDLQKDIEPPQPSIDATGGIPLDVRARWLHYADFFVGGSTGLAWLAWSQRCPVVMISGFTAAHNEFACERVEAPPNVCRGCWNEADVKFNLHSRVACPRMKEFECSTSITPEMVIEAIDRVRGVGGSKGVRVQSVLGLAQ